MSGPTYHLTETTLVHLEKAVRDTARRWDLRQAETYASALLSGFQYIADNHGKLNTPHRKKLAKGTNFGLHLVEHHYVLFKVHDHDNVIIVGILHERMNIPVRLKELQTLSQEEIAALEEEIESEQNP